MKGSHSLDDVFIDYRSGFRLITIQYLEYTESIKKRKKRLSFDK